MQVQSVNVARVIVLKEKKDKKGSPFWKITHSLVREIVNFD